MQREATQASIRRDGVPVNGARAPSARIPLYAALAPSLHFLVARALIGRYGCHFRLRWGATYKQQPFIVRNSAVVGSPKLGIVNHGGYGHGGHGFWLQGGGVDVIDNVAIGHSYSAYGFFVANNRIVSYGGPAEPNNPLTQGTRWERLDVFLTENLKDSRLAHGKPYLHNQSAPTDLTAGVNLVPVRIGALTRYLPVGAPPTRRYQPTGAGQE